MRTYARLLSSCIVLAALGVVPAAPAQDLAFKVEIDTKASQLVFDLGPIDLPAAMPDMPEMVMQQPPAQAAMLPVDGYLHGFTVELVDETGRVLPSVLLHHVNIIAPQRRELFSPIMQRVGAAGAETGPLHLPRLIGYPVSRGDSLIFTVMFHNPTEASYVGVRMRLRMRYSGRGSLMPTIAIQPFYIDVMPPAGYHAYTLPPGKSAKSWQGSPAVPGRVLGLGGHMHKYGTLLRFEDGTAGKVLWEAEPVVDSAGEVIAMPRKFFWWRLGIQVLPSHTYRLTAEYDNPTGEAIEEGAMGTLGGVFVPDERASWPGVDRSNPEYVADVKVTYARNSGEVLQHHH